MNEPSYKKAFARDGKLFYNMTDVKIHDLEKKAVDFETKIMKLKKLTLFAMPFAFLVLCIRIFHKMQR